MGPTLESIFDGISVCS